MSPDDRRDVPLPWRNGWKNAIEMSIPKWKGESSMVGYFRSIDGIRLVCGTRVVSDSIICNVSFHSLVTKPV